MNFVANTLPKPVLFALAYRLTVLHLASFILPTIGADRMVMFPVGLAKVPPLVDERTRPNDAVLACGPDTVP